LEFGIRVLELKKKKMAEEWYESFPAPRATPSGVTAEEVMKLFDDMDIKPEPRSFLLVDVRRVDWEVCCQIFPSPFPGGFSSCYCWGLR